MKVLERTKNIALVVLFVAVAALATMEYTEGPKTVASERTSATAGPRLPL